MTSRINEIARYYNLSISALAVRCGLKDNTLSNQLNGNRKLSLETINAILLTFENVSAEWLLRGEGGMLKFPVHGKKNDDRVNKLIDTIAFQQGTITSQSAKLSEAEAKIKKLEKELALLRTHKNII